MNEWAGTPWGGTDVSTKAEVGPFVANVSYGSYLSSLANTPQKRMREAQALYHSNPWIRSAENVVTRKAVGLPWHLETADDENIEDNATGPEGELLKLIERPQANLPDIGRKMTRRGLWSITIRHMGLCGMAYWFLDQLDPIAKTPLGIVYVNPARVWPASDANGNLVGWVLDAKDEQGRGGTPLNLEELLPFYLNEPDWGHIASGLVEAAWQKANITNLADRHAAYILGTGGRLPGIISPKEGTIPDDAYAQLVREFRNVNEAPDAAKRTTVVRGPIDFTGTGSDPSDLLLNDIASMNRDDIFAIWGVNPSQAGVPTAGGLNSGETRKYDEAVLMQGAVHDRVVAFRETLQFGLIDRYEKLGLDVDIEIEEPEFDDAAPMYENAQRATQLPLTNAERRAIIGLDPTGDDIMDNLILLPSNLLPLDTTPVIVPQKASADRPFLGLRSKVETRFTPSIRKSVSGVLSEQASAVASRIREKGAAVARKPKDWTIWWNAKQEDERLAKVLRNGSTGIATTVARSVADLLEAPQKARRSAPDYESAVIEFVTKRTGERVTEINVTTRDAIVRAVTEGFDQGLSPAQVAALIEDLPAFDAARAELVARTETMFAYNDAALTSYREFDVTEVLAYDGDEDAECAERNGNTYSIEEAAGITDHPNGTLDWAPVVGRAYLDEPVPTKAEPPVLRLEVGHPPEPQVIPAPIVNIEAAAPAAAPFVNVDLTPVAAAIERVMTRQPRILRDKDGRITGVEMVSIP